MNASFLSCLTHMPGTDRFLAQQQRYAPCKDGTGPVMRPVQGRTHVLQVKDTQVVSAGFVVWPAPLDTAAILSVNCCEDVWYVKALIPPAEGCAPVLVEYKVRADQPEVRIEQEYDTASSGMSRFRDSALAWDAYGTLSTKQNGEVRTRQLPLNIYDVTYQNGDFLVLGGVFGASTRGAGILPPGIHTEQIMPVPASGAWLYRVTPHGKLQQARMRQGRHSVRTRSVIWSGEYLVLSMNSTRDARFYGGALQVERDVSWEDMMEASDVVVRPREAAVVMDLQSLVDDFMAGSPADNLKPLYNAYLDEKSRLSENCSQCELGALHSRYVMQIRDICLKKM